MLKMNGIILMDNSILIGDLLVNVTYTLTEDNSLDLSFKALATKPTPVNLANHVYFNLGEKIM